MIRTACARPRSKPRIVPGGRSLPRGQAAGWVFLLVPVLALSPPAAAQERHYQDKSIRMIVGSAPGGGYDAYARLVAAHLKRHIPGNPTIVVQNMPGAGSLVAANHLYNVAPRDGTVIGAVNALLATDPLLHPERVRFDSRQFRWIGSALRETHVGIAWHTSPVRGFADVFKQELLVAGSGGSTNLYPVFVAGLLGARLRMIPGYQGTRNGLLAMERGEVAGNFGVTWASLKATNAAWIKEGRIRVFVQIARARHPELTDIPWIYDHARSEDDRAAMDLVFGGQDFGRPYLTPPGVPDAVVGLLRTAFERMMDDREFLDDARKRAIDLDFTAGADIQALIDRLHATSPSVVARVKTIIGRTTQ